MDISKDYLTLVGQSVSKLASFHLSMMSDSTFEKKAEEMYPGLTDKKGHLSLLIFDLIKCYRCMGHDMDINSKESLGLFLAITKGYDKIDSTYIILNAAIESTKEEYKTVVESVSSQVDSLPGDYDFLMGEILSDLGQKSLRKRYYVLLFRFCKIVSVADKVINPRECRWIADLLKISEGAVDKIDFSDFTVNWKDIEEDSRKDDTRKNNGPDKEYSDKKDERKEEPKKDQQKGPSKDVKKDPVDLQSIQERMKNSEAIKELDSMPGLSTVKQQVHSLTNFALVQIMREAKGMKKTPLSLHCVFSGNPGTGKTTVARLMGKIYKDLGLLKRGHMVETDRSGLVADYIGQTATKTNEVIDRAKGGVLFIDEAYALVNDAKSDFGHEAISTLLKRMEDDRDGFVVILAGYSENMQGFIGSNPGLQSRFSRMINFEDYTAEELLAIFERMISQNDYVLTEDAKSCVLGKFQEAVSNKGKDFGNGRFARNIFEKVLEIQACRVAFIPNVDEDTLRTITLEDIQNL